MTQDYSQMYNTQPVFNKTVVEGWIKQRKIENLQHWFKHGTPHKKLATVAFESAVKSDFTEAMELVWNSGWVNKKPLLSAGWHVVRFKMIGPQTQPAEAGEVWLFEKTYHSKEITKADTITLNAQILETLLHRHETDRWDIHVNMLPDLAGKAYRDLSTYATYAAGYSVNKNDEEKKLDYTKQIARFNELSDRNVFQDGWTTSELLVNEFEDGFFKIMNQDQIGLSGKELFMLFARLVTFYKLYRCQKVSEEQYEKEMDLILTSFKRWKLPETITYTAKEIEKDYYNLFETGSFGYFKVTSRWFIGLDMYIQQVPKIDVKNPVDTTFYAGDVWFTSTDLHDKSRKDRYLKLVEATNSERLQFREAFKKLL